MSSKPLPRQLRRLYDALDGKPYLHVYEVYRALRGHPWPGAVRDCQQRLGPTVTRFNRETPWTVQPGPEPYTYTLVKD